MTEEKKKGFRALLPDGGIERVRFFVSLALSLLLIATCVWYAVSCILIYSADTDTPFTREIVGEHLGRLLPISLITVALTAAAGVLSLFTKAPKKTLPFRWSGAYGLHLRYNHPLLPDNFCQGIPTPHA